MVVAKKPAKVAPKTTPAKKRTRPGPVLRTAQPGLMVFDVPVWKYRYLFADGTIIDIVAPWPDGSELRGAVRDVLGYNDKGSGPPDNPITGSADLGSLDD